VVAASITGMDQEDLRVLALLATWFATTSLPSTSNGAAARRRWRRERHDPPAEVDMKMQMEYERRQQRLTT
jgi:hypothetical protein